MMDRLQQSGINTYAGVWTFGILICLVLLLLFGFNWIT
jgi:hypothetical protein